MNVLIAGTRRTARNDSSRIRHELNKLQFVYTTRQSDYLLGGTSGWMGRILPYRG